MAKIVDASKISLEMEKDFKKLTVGLRKAFDPVLQLETIFCDGCFESGTFGSTAFANHLKSCDGHIRKKTRSQSVSVTDDDGEEEGIKKHKKKSGRK